ncbi:MAG TPA: hypothetical protein VK614_14625 [Allosphingosinicella sp.]|nr:hypothetical protein [Allosphingosinicella sp.]
MDEQVRIGFARASRLRKLTATAAIALAVSGCVSPAFRESVGSFGAATKAAVTAQRQEIASLQVREQAEQREALVTGWTVLELTDGCAEMLRNTVPPGETPPEAPQCALTRHGSTEALQAYGYRNIVALDDALSAYADSLIALAADNTASQAAFAGSLTSLATSASNLNDAIRQASGQAEAALGPKLTAIAGLVGELGNLYFAHERNRVLRKVIREGEPIIRRAIEVLAQTAAVIAREQRTALGLDNLQGRASDLALGRRDQAELRRAQQQLFVAVDSFNRLGANKHLFDEMATAHRTLVQAARQGASAADIQAAFDAIIHLATTAHNTVTALGADTRSTSNAN